MSADTAELLIEAGKENWVKKRPDVITAKGKGEIQTYWLVDPHKANEEDEEEEKFNEHTLTMRLRHASLDALEESVPPKSKRLSQLSFTPEKGSGSPG